MGQLRGSWAPARGQGRAWRRGPCVCAARAWWAVGAGSVCERPGEGRPCEWQVYMNAATSTANML